MFLKLPRQLSVETLQGTTIVLSSMSRVLFPARSVIVFSSVPINFARPTGEYIQTDSRRTAPGAGSRRGRGGFLHRSSAGPQGYNQKIHHPHKAMGYIIVTYKGEDEHYRHGSSVPAVKGCSLLP